MPLTVGSADETEIYFSSQETDVRPNVLFLIDSSGSMRERVSGDAENRTRMQVLKDSFSGVMEGAPADLNVGLMHYANSDLGKSYWWSSAKGVNFPATPVDEAVSPLIESHQDGDNLPNPAHSSTTVRSFLGSIVNNWEANGYTPIVDSLYEASRYFRGDAVGWGADEPLQSWSAHPLTYEGDVRCTVSHEEDCMKSWGRCNSQIVPGSCHNIQHNGCCNWVTTGGDGSGYCVNQDFSCMYTLEECRHVVCDDWTATVNYKSPMEYSCQANYLVLMSDGKPEYPYYPGNGESDGTLYYPPSSDHYPGSAGYAANYTASIKVDERIESYIGQQCEDSPLGYASGTCGSELTHWLAENDQSSDLEGDQFVETYAVSFAMNDEPTGTAYLRSLVTAENGFFTAENATELSAAFRDILQNINKKSASFSSPTYSVDESSLLAHSDELFIPIFNFSPTAQWSGNLKKFKRTAVTVDGKTTSQIVGQNDAVAVDAQGQFTDEAFDFWGSVSSGDDVTQGGAASQLPAPENRNLYIDADGYDLSKLDKHNTAISNGLLSYKTRYKLQDWWGGKKDGISCHGWYTDCDGNKLQVRGNPLTNSGCVNIEEVTTCSLTDIDQDTLIDFTRGVGKDGEPRQHMGDMLNTKPTIVNYDNTQLILAGTNEGFLHAIDAETGVEQWGFMPRSLLRNQVHFYKNEPTQSHIYGLDGAFTYWEYDHNQDGKIAAEDGDFRALYFGLRRGGMAYYALDITSPSTPRLMWKLENVLDEDNGTWNALGETWSKPTLAVIRTGTGEESELRHVLVFGAGYDSSKDEEDTEKRSPDSLGRDVMIVDAKRGPDAFKWSLREDVANASVLLEHSIPGDIRVLDMDRNGALDRLYFSDTGGNVWRVDMDHDLRDSDSSMYDYGDARLTKLAALGEDNDSGDDMRKFFYEPDTALIRHEGQVIMTISLGSGYRTHPLNDKTNDRFYVLRDPAVYQELAEDFVPITSGDLRNAKLDLTDTDSLLNGNFRGWYHDLNFSAEKVLAPAVTFLNKVIFTTFAAVDEAGQGHSGDVCEVPPNTARAYVLNLFNGQPVTNLDRSDDNTKDEYVIAGFNEILDGAKIVFLAPTAADGGECKEGDCQQLVEIRTGKMQIPLMDDSNSNNLSPGWGANDIVEKTDLTDILPRIFWLDHEANQH